MDPFRTRFILVDNSYAQRRRIVHTDDALTVVEQSIEDDSNELIEGAWCAYKILLCQELKPNYQQARRTFGHQSRFNKNKFFSDKAHFWLIGYVKKQNCHIWSDYNPQAVVEMSFFNY